MDAKVLIDGTLVLLGLVVVVAALIERPTLAMRRWDELGELGADMRVPRTRWGWWFEYAFLFGLVAIVMFFVWLHLVTYPDPGLFSDAPGSANAPGRPTGSSVSNAPGP